MSILYCTVPHFAAALTRRDRPALPDGPLILVGPEDRVFGVSAEAAACGVAVGMPSRIAQVRCPEASLVDADVTHCRGTFEALLELLERVSPSVEPHGWEAAYVDLGDMARARESAVALCRGCGRAIRQELGSALQPALGWDSGKFTAQAAARRARPGHILAIAAAAEQTFLSPLPVQLLPLEDDVVERLRFLGLRTMGQYAALSTAAVWQQFGKPGRLAHRYARGEDNRPVVPRRQTPRLAARWDLEVPLVDREWLLAVLRRMVSPLLAEVRGSLRACGGACLSIYLEDGSVQEGTRSFLFPTADQALVTRSLEGLLDRMRWTAPAVALSVSLEQIQDQVVEQLTLFPAACDGVEDEREHRLGEVARYLAVRFGANRLRRASLIQPHAPLPEWRAQWRV
jgi:nucleotidyltransferase/DNA polymerase involved in DNA repair